MEAPKTSADLGQKEAKNEALREEQLRHMEAAERIDPLNGQKRRSGL